MATNASPDDVSDKSSPGQSRHVLACFQCREAKQKCNKKKPCARCISSGAQCRYPATSHRGRKPGSSNKPETAEKWLQRLSRSSVRDEVISALLASARESSQPAVSTRSQSRVGDSDDTSHPYNGAQDSIYSPLQILADTVSALNKTSNIHNTIGPLSEQSGYDRRMDGFASSSLANFEKSNSASIDGRLSVYFAPRVVDVTDWEVFAAQSAEGNSPLQLAVNDPVTARLIDQGDIDTYFDLFFRVRNPLIGLMDPDLHTPEFVRSRSFTLFSVICALGCAVSERSKDKLLYPALMSLAEGNVKWSIGAPVKSIETIQALINMTYWAPAGEKQSDEPYWLRLSHATQLARDLGINRPAVVAEKLAAAPAMSDEMKQRLLRNTERTWIYLFVADKSFGIITGRPMCISWRELPARVSSWWSQDGAAPLDRLVCGIVEMRIIMLKALEERKQMEKTKDSILHWRHQTFEALRRLRDTRCAPDQSPSSASLPVLAFYMEYSLLLLNSHALRYIALDSNDPSSGLPEIFGQNVDIATRLMDLTLFDPLLSKVMRGFQNTQFVMLCHAAAEIIQAVKRGFPSYDAMRVTTKVHMVLEQLESTARALPPSSWASLYSGLYKVFARELDNLLNPGQDSVAIDDHFALFADWWNSIDGDSPDMANWIGMNFFDQEQQIMDPIGDSIANYPGPIGIP